MEQVFFILRNMYFFSLRNLGTFSSAVANQGRSMQRIDINPKFLNSLEKNQIKTPVP